MLIRLLETEIEREQMYRLVHDEYFKAGYIESREDGRFVHYQGILDRIPQTDVFLAYNDEDELIGTNSLTRDSDNGIHTRLDFPLQTMRERGTGKNLASSWRIVARSDSGFSVVSNLIKATVRRAVAIGVETCLFTFHPRHYCQYQRGLNLELIGFNEHTDGLRNAPAVLMRIVKKDIPERWL